MPGLVLKCTLVSDSYLVSVKLKFGTPKSYPLRILSASELQRVHAEL